MVPKSASLLFLSKDPFASRNAVLLVFVGIIKVSGRVVRQAVFVVKPIVGARMRDRIQVWCFAGLGAYRYTQLSQINVSYCIFDKGRDRFGVGGRGITRH